jgi:hypothetical protein
MMLLMASIQVSAMLRKPLIMLSPNITMSKTNRTNQDLPQQATVMTGFDMPGMASVRDIEVYSVSQ